MALLTLGGGVGGGGGWSEKEVPKRDIHKRCNQNVSFWRKILEGGKSKKKERKKSMPSLACELCIKVDH